MSARDLVPLVVLGDAGALLAIHPECLADGRTRTPSLFAGPSPYFAPGVGPLPLDAACCAGRSCAYAPPSPYLGWGR